MDDVGDVPERRTWSRRKKDPAPRGVFRHPSGDWAIRFTCGAGHKHKERIGRVKTDAKDALDARRARVRQQPGWCPTVETQHAKERSRAEQKRQAARVSFREYADDYLKWAQNNKRAWATERSCL